MCIDGDHCDIAQQTGKDTGNAKVIDFYGKIVLIRNQCTKNQNSVKVVTRHVWKSDMEQTGEIPHTTGMREKYQKCKETIEKILVDAKERETEKKPCQIGDVTWYDGKHSNLEDFKVIQVRL